MRPKDAATLIILRKNGNKIEILMGKRHLDHVFMPGVYVFPGGKVDLADSRIKAHGNVSDKTQKLLLNRMYGRKSIARANAMILAAIRETFEETGYIIGQKVTDIPNTRSAGWQDFFNSGHTPATQICKFVARAITPPGGKRRYDTRFFAVWLDDIPNGMTQQGNGTDELEGLNWVSFDQVRQINAPVITKTIIYELQNQIHQQAFIEQSPVPFYHYYQNKMRRDEIIVCE